MQLNLYIVSLIWKLIQYIYILFMYFCILQIFKNILARYLSIGVGTNFGWEADTFKV